ncbi:MAG: PAS domain S-box protein, partial [Planctomycetes bacterium]|nr:PAS domain S-box protein [Planctomycetota bacterium]
MPPFDGSRGQRTDGEVVMRFSLTIWNKIVLPHEAMVLLGVFVFGFATNEIVSNNLQTQAARHAEDLRKHTRIKLAEDVGVLQALVRTKLDDMGDNVELVVTGAGVGRALEKLPSAQPAPPSLTRVLQGCRQRLRLHMLTLVNSHGRTILRTTNPERYGDDLLYRSQYESVELAANLKDMVDAALAGKTTLSVELFPSEVLALERVPTDVAEDEEDWPVEAITLADLAYIPFLDEGGKPVTRQERSAETRGMMLTVVAPVRSASGEVVAALVAGRLLNRDTQIVEQYFRWKANLPTIFLDALRIATKAGTDPGARPVGTLLHPEIAKALLSPENPDERFESPSELAAYRTILDSPGRIIGAFSVRIPTSVFELGLASQKLNQELARTSSIEIIWLTALTAGLLAFGITIVNAERISKPVRDLVRFAQSVAGGDLHARAPVRGAFEVKELGRTMNYMATELAKSYKLLEDKVAERTHDLQVSEEKYRDLIENAPDMIHTIDAQYTILTANEREARTLGYTRDELIGMKLKDIVEPRFWDQTLAATAKTFSGQDMVRYESALITKDKRSIPVEVTATARREDGRCVETRVILRDITERIEAEKEITRLAHTVRSISDSVVITDFDCKVTFVNEAFERTFGYKAAEVAGKHVFELHSPRNAAWVNAEILEAAYESRAGWHGELLAQRKNAEDFPVSMSISCVRNERGEFLALVNVFRDITEPKRLQEQLIQSEKLSAVGEMISGVAHEIRNPLNTLGITVRNLRDDVVRLERREEGKREYLESIGILSSELDRLNRILEDFMKVARVPEVVPEECRLERLLQDILKTVQNQASEL